MKALDNICHDKGFVLGEKRVCVCGGVMIPGDPHQNIHMQDKNVSKIPHFYTFHIFTPSYYE